MNKIKIHPETYLSLKTNTVLHYTKTSGYMNVWGTVIVHNLTLAYVKRQFFDLNS